MKRSLFDGQTIYVFIFVSVAGRGRGGPGVAAHRGGRGGWQGAGSSRK